MLQRQHQIGRFASTPLSVQPNFSAPGFDTTLKAPVKPLRLITCGSVDDGKSTLIGRLLWDTKSVSSDHAENLTDHANGEMLPEFAQLLDGLQAEREQGITIDVAYRYFSTPHRSFIIADTPGHTQYTRNMVTGGSTADLAVVLVDARTGILEQTRRHATICALMGIRQLVLVVNKMDLIGYDQQAFAEISSEFSKLAKGLDIERLTAIPVSALQGENVVARASRTMPWYDDGAGPTLLQAIEAAPLAAPAITGFRFPVQRVARPDESFRGYQGTIAGGEIRPGQEVQVLPGRQRAVARQILTFDGERSSAATGDAVTIVLDRPVDIARGDMLVSPGALPLQASRFVAKAVSLSDEGLVSGQRYWLKAGSRRSRVEVAVTSQLDLESGQWLDTAALPVNGIGQVRLQFDAPTQFDAYGENQATGSFILIDPQSHNTVAAGMISGEMKGRQREYSQDEALMTWTLPAAIGEELLNSDLFAAYRSEIRISRGIGNG